MYTAKNSHINTLIMQSSVSDNNKACTVALNLTTIKNTNVNCSIYNNHHYQTNPILNLKTVHKLDEKICNF